MRNAAKQRAAAAPRLLLPFLLLFLVLLLLLLLLLLVVVEVEVEVVVVVVVSRLATYFSSDDWLATFLV